MFNSSWNCSSGACWAEVGVTETLKPNLDEAWTFVSNMSRGRPVHLAAIAEGERVVAATFEPHETSHVANWITDQAGKNIYFHVNALRAGAKNKKATKDDVEEVLAFHTDIDNPEAFELLDNFPLRPTVVVASGGGRQAFWLLREPLRDLALAERLNKAIAGLCGGDHCWNIDRLMRVPGTVNVPNAKKRAAGRVPILARVIEADWKRLYDAEDFLPFDPGPGSLGTALVLADLVPVGRDKLPEGVLTATLSLLENGDDPDRPRGQPNPRFKSRSESVYRAACDLARLGCSAEFIAGVLLNPQFRISESVLEKRRPEAYALRQATKAIESAAQGWPDTFKSGAPKPSMRNARAALRRLGLSFAYDMFRHRKMVDGHVIEQFAGEITDDACMMLRGLILDRFGFDPGTQHVQDAIMLMCIEEPEHPVREMLDNLKWDGVARLETWLSRYLGAADTPLNRAIGTIMLVAAVRRVRVPGVKFDQIIVFEGAQGTGKSTAVKILAGEEFHSDQEILSLEPKAQLELLDGVWFYEINELEGMNRAEVAKIKAFASRQVDRARLAYGRNAVSRPRQVIFIGTTNEDKYLRDQTGNRRFWPVRTGVIDLPALAGDRDQLLAEAAYRESQGASLALPPELWQDAAVEQEARVEEDPWVEQIEGAVPIVAGDKLRFVTTSLLTDVLGIRPEYQNQGHTKRLSALMKRLGWRNEKFKLHGKAVRGYEKAKPDGYEPPPKPYDRNF